MQIKNKRCMVNTIMHLIPWKHPLGSETPALFFNILLFCNRIMCVNSLDADESWEMSVNYIFISQISGQYRFIMLDTVGLKLAHPFLVQTLRLVKAGVWSRMTIKDYIYCKTFTFEAIYRRQYKIARGGGCTISHNGSSPLFLPLCWLLNVQTHTLWHHTWDVQDS